MRDRLWLLAITCRRYHLPKDHGGIVAELETQGLAIKELCPADGTLQHAVLPENWAMEDDEASLSSDGNGSVVLVDGDGHAVAYIVADAHNTGYELILP